VQHIGLDCYWFYFDLRDSAKPGLPAVGGAAGRVAAAPDDAPLPIFLLPPPPDFTLASSSSMRALSSSILKKRASRLQAKHLFWAQEGIQALLNSDGREVCIAAYHHSVKQMNAIQKLRSERHFLPMLPA